MRISDWSSDVCSSDLVQRNSSGSSRVRSWTMYHPGSVGRSVRAGICRPLMAVAASESVISCPLYFGLYGPVRAACLNLPPAQANVIRSEEHTSELQSLMRISYAVFCLKKKKHSKHTHQHKNTH